MTTAVKPAEQPLVRVVRGALADEELAALTAVLLSRAGAAGESQAAAQEAPRPAANWRRLERAGGYRAPHSWQG